VAQHVDVGDRLTTISDHHRDIGQHPPAVVDRDERPPAIALDNSVVRTLRSARSRNATLPAWATTPTPSPETDRPADDEVGFTYGLPSKLENWGRCNPKFPLLGRHFRVSTRRSRRRPVNDPG